MISPRSAKSQPKLSYTTQGLTSSQALSEYKVKVFRRRYRDFMWLKPIPFCSSILWALAHSNRRFLKLNYLRF